MGDNEGTFHYFDTYYQFFFKEWLYIKFWILFAKYAQI